MSSTVTSAGCEMTTASISSDFDSSTATFPVNEETNGVLLELLKHTRMISVENEHSSFAAQC